MLIDIEAINNPIQLATVISGNDQPQIEVDFNLQRGTINIEVDLNYSIIDNSVTNNITQNITNVTNNFSLLTFTYQDIC